MNVIIDRNRDTPLYVQIRDQIRYLIEIGNYKPGEQLPTGRELADHLNINRNTILKAYSELEASGYIQTRRGCGVFVAGTRNLEARSSTISKALGIIDEAINNLISLGLSADDIWHLTRNRLQEQESQLPIRIGFVECHQQPLQDYVDHLHLRLGLPVSPILLSELRVNPKISTHFDLIVTTFFHLSDVSRALQTEDAAPDIFCIALTPHLNSLLTVSRLPNDSRIGIICFVEETAQRMQDSFIQAGLTHLHFQSCSPNEPDLFKTVIEHSTAVLVTPDCREIVTNMAPSKPLIEFSNMPDEASVQALIQMIQSNPKFHSKIPQPTQEVLWQAKTTGSIKGSNAVERE